MYLERKLRRKKIKRILIVVIPILILLIGTSFAFFTFYKANEAFILTMKGVPMQVEFKEVDNVIEVPFAYPISDEYAIANLDKLGYVDFTVRGGTPNNEYLYYELYLTEEDGNTLDSNYIKVYLTDDKNQKVVEPSIYNNLSQSTSENTNGKILHSESLTGIFEKNYRLYVWIDKDYTQNKVNQTFSFKVNLYAGNRFGIATNVIKNQLVKYSESSKDDFTGGLVAVNTAGELYNETDETEEIREYRYSGSYVNNYVTFNDETWRIIGIFYDEEDDEEYLRLVKNEVISEDNIPQNYIINIDKTQITYNIKKSSYFAYWNKKNNILSNNDWSSAGLQYYLNSEYDDTQVNKGYMNYLSITAKTMLQDRIYYLGCYTYDTDTPALSYNHERDVKNCINKKGTETNTSKNLVEANNGCRVWANNASIWDGKIALMYPSDYGYSSNQKYWSTTKLEYGEFNINAKDTSWIYQTIPVAKSDMLWMLSPSSTNSNLVSNYGNGGYIRNDANYSYAVLPVINLKSNVKITGGDGTINNQYKLSID